MVSVSDMHGAPQEPSQVACQMGDVMGDHHLLGDLCCLHYQHSGAVSSGAKERLW